MASLSPQARQAGAHRAPQHAPSPLWPNSTERLLAQHARLPLQHVRRHFVPPRTAGVSPSLQRGKRRMGAAALRRREDAGLHHVVIVALHGGSGCHWYPRAAPPEHPSRGRGQTREPWHRSRHFRLIHKRACMQIASVRTANTPDRYRDQPRSHHEQRRSTCVSQATCSATRRNFKNSSILH